MRVVFDTSVLVAGIVETHPDNDRAFPWLKRAKEGEFELIVATHTLAELYAVLTTLPVRPRISPGMAWRLIYENATRPAKLISISISDYNECIQSMVDLGLVGGTVYDALLVSVVKKTKADRLLTLNMRDFERVWPEGRGILAEP